MSDRSVFRLDGEVALITGGGTGLGLAMARSMAAAGARVVIVGRREAVLREAVTAIGHDAIYMAHDVSEVKRVHELVAAVEKRAGAALSILVNNAGIHVKKWALETTEQEFNSVYQTNVMGAFALAQAVAPSMIAKKHGSILFIASMATLFGIPQVVAYSAAKAAYGGMVRALAVELSPHEVRVNAIAPGWIESDMSRKALAADPERRRRILERTPMRRLGTADDVAHAAVYLSSRAAQFVTGVVLPVDGGISIGF
jgi:NAD(P)-dependent dehydrogenase (short-subunit alcohol dehydrogenase family)